MTSVDAVSAPAAPAVAIVLAAGEGKRMRSRRPKVLHEIAGRPLVGHVLGALAPLQPGRTAVVVGVGREQVSAALPDDVLAVVQEQQLGTGHAVRTALDALAERDDLDETATVVVVPGDAPLLRAQTLNRLVTRHVEQQAAATLLTAVLDDPTGYGRVVREGATSPGGTVRAVVEERDADVATRAIREVATSVYAFTAGPLRRMLAKLSRDNAQGEEYLTDVIGLLNSTGAVVQAVLADDASEVAGVNDRVQLAAAGRVLNDRLVTEAMLAGATVVDPATTWLDVGVRLGRDVTLLPNTRLAGATVVEDEAVVGPECSLVDTAVGAGARVRSTTADQAEIGPGCDIGPYTYLRPGTRLARRAKAGAFVETKAASIGEGAKVPHLTYVGDAEVGAGSNIGCGVVFVNYDGVDKHRTVVGEAAFVGSDTMLVAPVTIGDGAYTAAGSVITKDVPPGAIAVARGQQRTVEGWVERRRPGTRSAEAARRARERQD